MGTPVAPAGPHRAGTSRRDLGDRPALPGGWRPPGELTRPAHQLRRPTDGGRRPVPRQHGMTLRFAARVDAVPDSGRPALVLPAGQSRHHALNGGGRSRGVSRPSLDRLETSRTECRGPDRRFKVGIRFVATLAPAERLGVDWMVVNLPPPTLRQFPWLDASVPPRYKE